MTLLVVLVVASVWFAALVLALALCRPAAAGDRATLDAEVLAARKLLAVRRAYPELPVSLANLERTMGQRKRKGISASRGPAASSEAPARRARAS